MKGKTRFYFCLIVVVFLGFLLTGFTYSFELDQIKILYYSRVSNNWDVYLIILDSNLNVTQQIRLTDQPCYDATPCWSPDGSKIAFESTYGGNNETWTMDIDGSNMEKTVIYQYKTRPQIWSQIHNKIYGYYGGTPEIPPGDQEVAEFDILTKTVIPLTFVPNYNTDGFDLYQNETKIVFARGLEGNGRTNNLFTADFISNGNDFQNIVQIPLSVSGIGYPKVSPNESRFVFSISSVTGIGIVNVDGSGYWAPISGAYWAAAPNWIDDNRIVLSYSETGPNPKLCVLDLRDLSIFALGTTTPEDYQPRVLHLKVVDVNIDIKPGIYPNSINLGSNGNVPVAILSDENFDASTVDPLSVRLAGAEVRIKGKGDPQANIEDVDGDGLIDIVVHVDTKALELSAEDTEAILTGETYDGIKFQGVDTVRIVNE